MKRILYGLLPLVFLLGCDSSTSTVVALEDGDAVAAAKSENAAEVFFAEGCQVPDATGVLWYMPDATRHYVVTNNDNENRTYYCKGTLPEEAVLPDRAIRWDHASLLADTGTYLSCSALINIFDFNYVLAPSGKFSVVCHAPKDNEVPAKSDHANGAVVYHDNEGCAIIWDDPFFGPSLWGVYQEVYTPSGNMMMTCNTKMPDEAPLPDKAVVLKDEACQFSITPGGTTHATCRYKP